MIPSGYKEDKLYSVKPRNGDGDFTFTRASTGTRVNADGYIEEVAWNIVEHSEELDDSYWTDDNTLTITENDSTSPIGNTTANKLVVNSGSSNAYVYRFEPTIGEKTLSVYGKKGAKNWLMLACLGAAKRVFFDLDNGVIGTNVGSLGASISDEGNGWYRCSITFTYTSGNSAVYFYVTDNDNTFTVTGNNSDELYLWGAMVNKGNTPKPYIKTTDRLDIPRLDYSGGATNPTLLLEGQSTNLVTYSEDFSQWGTLGTDVVEYVSTLQNPDGLLGGYKVKGSGIYLSASLSATTQRSIYARSVSGSGDVQLMTHNSNTNNVFTLTEQWQRLDLNSVTSSTGETNFYIDLRGASTTLSELYVWGAMAETGSYPTSYIPTSGTSTTRIKDVCDDAGDATIFNDSEGVLFVEIASLSNVGVANRSISISDGSNTNQIVLRFASTANQITAYITDGGVITAQLTHTLTNALNYNKLALKYKVNDVALWVNGTEVATDTNATMPSGFDELKFSRADGVNKFEGKCKQLIYFNQTLTDEELEKLTTL